MKIKPIAVLLNGQTYEIGRLEPWKDDPKVFDGWLEESGGVVDDLVVNGASEHWARYLVLARYMGVLLAEIDSTESKTEGAGRLTMESAAERLTATAQGMEAALTAHLAPGN